MDCVDCGLWTAGPVTRGRQCTVREESAAAARASTGWRDDEGPCDDGGNNKEQSHGQHGRLFSVLPPWRGPRSCRCRGSDFAAKEFPSANSESMFVSSVPMNDTNSAALRRPTNRSIGVAATLLHLVQRSSRRDARRAAAAVVSVSKRRRRRAADATE